MQRSMAMKLCLLTEPNLLQLQRNDRAINRPICNNIKPGDGAAVRSRDLLAKLEVEDERGFTGIDMWNSLAMHLQPHVL